MTGVQTCALPILLLVTASVPVATPTVFAAFDAAGAAATRDTAASLATSRHLAAELGAGLRAADLVVRAGVLAMANDLANVAMELVPGLQPLRRALVSRLRRSVGLSGSGPTLWALYPSLEAAEAAAGEVRAGLADGSILAPGETAPFVVATTIAADGETRP